MKRKKRERNGLVGGNHAADPFATVFYLFFFRRRHRLFPLLSAASGCILLVLAAVSVFAPPPTATNDLLHHSSPVNDGAALVSLELEADNTLFQVPDGGGNLGRHLWSSRGSEFYYGCSNASHKFQTADVKMQPNRYLMIATSGGLNQQRTGITDAVVVAYILNATLVIPKLDQNSYWNDSSNFGEIFDVDWFISSLMKDVMIIKELPSKRGKVWTPYNMRVPRKCNRKCYENQVLPVLNKKHAVQLTKFDYRLSNRLETDLQKLRCRVNYHALRFTDPILQMGQLLVDRMRMKTKHFIALHLRFEPDMLAFSGCYYGGGDKERKELGAIRKRWKTLHASNPEKVRRHGRCPLTPEEVGLMLRALGFGSDVHIYVASGEVYGGEETLAPLKALFPNFHSKETIATKEELEPFSAFSSRMAALDYIVCDESDVFVTNNNGNMARMLAGRRRYFGHKPTIRPNAKKLYRFFLNRNNMTWEEFASKVRTNQIGFMGEPNEVKPGRGEFHENPSSCICEDSEAKARGSPTAQNQTPEELINKENNKDAGDATDEQSIEDEQDASDVDYLDIRSGLRELPNETNIDTIQLKPEQPEVEEFFSD
ncbi:hypothetical protein SLEP1_g33820 [Rubroshorea leprosula]|uniref:O-fucosyltransferase family protein n=1 Tax=Rubroshorea leprosula TaxID=152421 RepID=A0AAV5KI49_9ROSI|nr:hypothetical protein SLEP1_g33820 [Rubroshorea leprosula]